MSIKQEEMGFDRSKKDFFLGQILENTPNGDTPSHVAWRGSAGRGPKETEKKTGGAAFE